jgi:thymidylate synthase (FAD)
MKLIKPSIEFIWVTENPLQVIERAGRTCYKSEDKITSESAVRFVKMLIDKGHEAMIEHASASYRFICDRGVTHEIVRHRLFSYAQESTRYCNYKGGVTFIIPQWMPEICSGEFTHNELLSNASSSSPEAPSQIWLKNMLSQEQVYKQLIELGWQPQQARSVLPNSLKTEIVITGNLRQWRQFFKLRCNKAAHPQLREVAHMALENIKTRIPVVFDDFDNVMAVGHIA